MDGDDVHSSNSLPRPTTATAAIESENGTRQQHLPGNLQEELRLVSEGGLTRRIVRSESAGGGENLLSSSGHQVGVEPSNGRPNPSFQGFFPRETSADCYRPFMRTPQQRRNRLCRSLCLRNWLRCRDPKALEEPQQRREYGVAVIVKAGGGGFKLSPGRRDENRELE